jgi:hypothetical protein
MNPFFLNLINANNNKQNDIMKLYLLKSLMEDDKPKKDHPFVMKPPKYLIQKYYPPAPNTNYIPVPQPILFKSPDYFNREILNKKRPTIKISLPKSGKERTNSGYESIPSQQKRKYKHHSKHRNETPSENEEEPEKSENPDEDDEEEDNKEEPEENEDNEEKGNTDKEKEDEESSEPDVRLRLYNPDNPEENKIVYPS